MMRMHFFINFCYFYIKMCSYLDHSELFVTRLHLQLFYKQILHDFLLFLIS